MNILNEVVKGASRQFGREFGRAGANAVGTTLVGKTTKSRKEHKCLSIVCQFY